MSEGYDDDFDDEPLRESLTEDAAAGAGRVKLPGAFMIATGIVNLLFGAFLGVIGMFMQNAPDQALQQALDQQGPEQKKALEQYGIHGPAELRKVYLFGCGGSGVLAILCSIVTVIGGFCMVARKARGLAFFSALVTVLPCVNSPCVLLGFPVGIWSLVVLSQPDVKAAFR
jgi:hypothetical protein